MGSYKLVVITRPVEGREDEFNDWYTNEHLADVLKVPGFAAAQRFRIIGEPTVGRSWDYFAVYEVEHDDPAAVFQELLARAGTDKMPLSDAMDPDLYCALYEPITGRIIATTK